MKFPEAEGDAMTPQERRLIDDLFDRLASLERGPRDPDAVHAINEGLKRAPNALYPLVQTMLVQDDALRQADARIRELESKLGVDPAQRASFLGDAREIFDSRREPQGSVPTVRPAATPPAGSKWRVSTEQPAAPQAPESSGSSFLGTAAATAAGVVGGALLMNSFRGMFGGQPGNSGSRALDSGKSDSPWNSGTGGGDLARDAGVNDIGGSRAGGRGDASASQRAGLFDDDQSDVGDADDVDFLDDVDDSFESGGGNDVA
jgi:uncharacterized protein